MATPEQLSLDLSTPEIQPQVDGMPITPEQDRLIDKLTDQGFNYPQAIAEAGITVTRHEVDPPVSLTATDDESEESYFLKLPEGQYLGRWKNDA